MSVIVSRALPDARDGLKPVQRRILYAMYDMGLRPDTSYKKSARVVGEVLGKYHPHGDSAVYDAMVRLAQDFSMRHVLVDGQGNFGSIDGDNAAAMRYTEARMSQMGYDLLADLEKNTVEYGPNFDESLLQPTVLPASTPNLLVNGSSGIAVGMATSIPPHNLGEVVGALVYMLDNWKTLDDVTVADLMQFIQGPDFPTGGIVYRNRDGDEESDALASAYATGRGRITVRAKVHVEQMERNKSRIVITELPYQTNKNNLMGRIADLHRDGKIEGLTDLRDESDRHGLRIIIEMTRNVEAEEVLEDLYRLTPLKSTFSIALLALVGNEPRVLTLKQALRVYLDHRLEVVRRRSEYDLDKARQRAHILEGLLIGLDNLDAVIDTIRRSRTAETARANLMKQFNLTEIQAQAILDTQLRRLAGMERKRLQDEYKEKLALIKELERLLGKPELMRGVVKQELIDVSNKFGDKRRTRIVSGSHAESSSNGNLMPDETVWIMVGDQGTVGRTSSAAEPSIARKPAEGPLALLQANTRDTLYLFSAAGQAIGVPVFQLPQSDEIGKGGHWATFSALGRNEHLVGAVVLGPDDRDEDSYLFLTTIGGVVKRVRLSDLPGVTSESFTVMNVAEDDALGWVLATSGDDEIVLATAAGMAIRFKEDSVRPMGLAAAGVMGVKLNGEEDGVTAADIVLPDSYLLSITDNGLAKATPIDDYPLQNRYGQGVINMRLPKGATEVVDALMVNSSSTLIIAASNGTTKKLYLRDVTAGGRTVKPAAVMALALRARVTGLVPVGGNLDNERKQSQREKATKSKAKSS
jgi:DNA gyrase subunit A